MTKLPLILSFLLFAIRLNAAIETTVSYLQGVDFLHYAIYGSAGSVTNTSILEIPSFNPLGNSDWENGYKIRWVKSRVELYIDPAVMPLTYAYKLTIPIKISFLDINHTLNEENHKLIIEYNPDEGSAHRQLDLYLQEGAYRFQVEVLTQSSDLFIEKMTVTSNQNPPNLTQIQKKEIANSVKLKLVQEYDKIINFDYNDSLKWSQMNFSFNSANNQLNVCWDVIQGTEYYDLEWSFVEKYNIPYVYSNLGITSSTFSFSANASRVSIAENCYKMPIVYESGALVFRVRAHGYVLPDIDNPVTGRWSCGSMSGTCNSYEGINPSLANWLHAYWVNDPHENDNKNWQVITSFAEEGKRKDVVNYMDGTMRTRQTVTVNNSDNNVLVAETMYDHQGRPAVQVLPASVLHDPALKFRANFNRNMAGQPYSKLDFDLDGPACNGQIAPMNSASGAAYYYSPQFYNQLTPAEKETHLAYIPKSDSFPMIQTEYTPDNTGRIQRQGGAGPTFQLESGHETKYFYATPAQEELDYLFGTNVGIASHYKKNMVIDPNTQVSISYLDAKGNTIATALAAKAPDNLEQLPSYKPFPMTIDLLAYNRVDSSNYSLDATFTLAVDSKGDHTFYYGVTAEQFRVDNCMPANVCYDCVYDLELLVVSNECPDTFYHLIKTIGSFIDTSIALDINNQDSLVFDINTTCNAPLHFNTNLLPINNEFVIRDLPVGTYSIIKKLKVNQSAALAYLDHYINDPNNICTNILEDILQEQLDNVNEDDCHIDCEDVVGSTDESDIELAKEVCDTLFTNPCDIAYEVMKSHLMPGGQYAQFEPSTYSANAYPLSIFNLNNKLKVPSINYQNIWGSGETVIIDGDTRLMNSLTVQEFIQNFDEEWLNTLVPIHPEYCMYERCSDSLAASETYTNYLHLTSSLQEANSPTGVTPVFINALNDHEIMLKDPYFFQQGATAVTDNPGPGQHHIAQMLNCMDHFPIGNAGDPSITDLALANSFCTGPGIFDPLCISSVTWANLLSNVVEANTFWSTYKSLYISCKERVEYQARTSYAMDPKNCYNECIGQENFNPFINKFWVDEYEFLEEKEPCSSSRYYLFKDKVKAFPSPYDILPNMNVDFWAYPPTAMMNNVLPTLPKNTCDSCNCEDEFSRLIEYALVSFLKPKLLDIDADYQKVSNYFKYLDIIKGIDLSTYINPQDIPGFSLLPGVSLINNFIDLNNYFNNFETLKNQVLNQSIPYEDLEIMFPKIKLLHYPFSDLQFSMNTDAVLTINFENSSLPSENTSEANWCHILTRLSLYDIININKINTTGCPYNDNIFNRINITFNIQDIFGNEYTRNGNSIRCGFNCKNSIAVQCEKLCPLDNLINIINILHNNIISTNPSTDPSSQHTILVNVNLLGKCIIDSLNIVKDALTEIPITVYIDPIIVKIKLNTHCELILYLGNNNSHFSNNKIIRFFNIIPDYGQMNSNGYTDKFLFNVEFQDGGIVTCAGSTNGCFSIGRCCKEELPQTQRTSQPKSKKSKKLEAKKIVIDKSRKKKFPPPIQTDPWPGPADPQLPQKPYDPLCSDCIPIDLVGGVFDTVDFGDCHGIWCDTSKWITMTLDSMPDPCIENLYDVAEANAYILYEEIIDSIESAFLHAYNMKCLQAVETFNDKAGFAQHHFTLYYYDQSNNLVQTVPPNGVIGLNQNEMASMATYRTKYRTLVTPNPVPTVTSIEHNWTSNYTYNSLNQLTTQKIPDQGYMGTSPTVFVKEPTLFWYDYLGRLVCSQNPEQKKKLEFSYTLYDWLGRIKEVGGLKFTAASSQPPPSPVDTTPWKLFVNNGNKFEITTTTYDHDFYTGTLPPGFPLSSVDNLRGRVGAAAIYDIETNYNNLKPDYITHYSYDIHGNVKSLVQDGKNTPAKLMEYEYDLISGKVNKVYYQSNKSDQFIHDYRYDADNRLTLVRTSHNGILWDEDAHYVYYPHGPLARTEIGENEIQGLDYAYTLQGWIKGMNSGNLQVNTDMGKDGMTSQQHQTFAKDEVGYVLNYYQGDYNSIAQHAPAKKFETEISSSSYNTASKNLYNGNIRAMITAIDRFMGAYGKDGPAGYSYQYDQLNRIKGMDYYSGLNNNSWISAIKKDDYQTRYSYDANGNILNLDRNGTTAGGNQLKMDRFTYNFKQQNNRLTHVDDVVNVSNYSTDIDDQQANNYKYDRLGNLIRDEAEGLSIEWNLSGKVSRIKKDNGDIIVFKYDALGNRISKRFKDTTTLYIRDASGNVMSHYMNTAPSNSLLQIWSLQSITLYGSSRLGVWYPRTKKLNPADSDIELPGGSSDPSTPTGGGSAREIKIPKPLKFQRYRGLMQYELTNHLGNVLATISDRKRLGRVPVGSSGIGIFAHLITAQDYYPFGSPMAGRTYKSSTNYRFGFNGIEKEDEINGAGNSYAFEYRMYDPRLGCFLSVDPFYKLIHSYSPYIFASNSVIQFIDLEGLQPIKPVCNWRHNSALSNEFHNNGRRDLDIFKSEGFTVLRQDVSKQDELNIFKYYYLKDNNWVAFTPKQTKLAEDIDYLTVETQEWAGIVVALSAGVTLTALSFGAAATAASTTEVIYAVSGIVSGLSKTIFSGSKLVLKIQGDIEKMNKIPSDLYEAVTITYVKNGGDKKLAEQITITKAVWDLVKSGQGLSKDQSELLDVFESTTTILDLNFKYKTEEKPKGE